MMIEFDRYQNVGSSHPTTTILKPMSQGKKSLLRLELTTFINSILMERRTATALPKLTCDIGGISISPDIAIFENKNIPKDDNGEIADVIRIAPNWIIEILSPDQSATYEYCIELLKNAKIRTSLVNSVSQSLDRITINPNKMNGQPCIRDLRLTVWRVIELLQIYPDRSELYQEFPELTEEDIKQAIINTKLMKR